MYLKLFKACPTIFQNIPKIDIGGGHLRGIWLNKIDIEANAYYHNSSDALVKKYLPNAYCLNENDARNKLEEYIERFLLKTCIPFTIAFSEKSIPIGYVLCHSPLVKFKDSDEQIGDWTIDFWLAQNFRGKKIMEHILNIVLGYLQTKEVDRVYMFVNKDNISSIKIIEKCGLINLGDVSEGKYYKFGIALKKDIQI